MTSTVAQNRINGDFGLHVTDSHLGAAFDPATERIAVYTDGSCYPNPGAGGWGWTAPALGEEDNGGSKHSTNQRMEITAAWKAVQSLSLRGPVTVISDSAYVVNCFKEHWYVKWRQRGWKRGKSLIANRDLWEPFIDLVEVRDVQFMWIKGHAGDFHNERADVLATEGRERLTRILSRPPPTDHGRFAYDYEAPL